MSEQNNTTEVKINMNILKEKAKKLNEITDEDFAKCNSVNVSMVKEYLRANKQLSPQTRQQYTTALKQFFYFVFTDVKDKPFYSITKRDFVNYLGYMQERGLSSSAISLRKSACSSFCIYIENIVADDMEECATFRNFTKGMPKINKTTTYQKIVITKPEYDKIMEVLLEKEHWLGLAWVATAFNVGCRRAEIIQFKTEILDYIIPEKKKYVNSHFVRGKGEGVDGKPIRYMIPLDVLEYWKQWVEKRGYESEYIFTTLISGKPQAISKEWADTFCKNIISPILGRRINPHIFKASCVTYKLEQGKDMKLVSQQIAHHNDVSTTSNFYDLRSFEDEIDGLFD